MSAGGSISRADNGTWGYVIDVPTLTGRRRQLRRRGFKTKKEAQTSLTTALSDLQRGMFVAPERATLASFLLDDWLPARAASLRPSTAASYEQVIRSYVAPTIGGVRLQAVDGGVLNQLYAALLANGRTETRRGLGTGLAPKTVRNVHGVLTKAFRDAVRWGRLQRNPCDAADPPRGRVPEMRAWNADQLRAFTTATRDHRWAAIWALMATTGLRRGEILGLRRDS